MQRIKINDYHQDLGTLIDLSHPEDYLESHHPSAINIPYQKFMLYYDRYLDKQKPYYFICQKGLHSNKVVRLLEYLGYNVTQVVY